MNDKKSHPPINWQMLIKLLERHLTFLQKELYHQEEEHFSKLIEHTFTAEQAEIMKKHEEFITLYRQYLAYNRKEQLEKQDEVNFHNLAQKIAQLANGLAESFEEKKMWQDVGLAKKYLEISQQILNQNALFSSEVSTNRTSIEILEEERKSTSEESMRKAEIDHQIAQHHVQIGTVYEKHKMKAAINFLNASRQRLIEFGKRLFERKDSDKKIEAEHKAKINAQFADSMKKLDQKELASAMSRMKRSLRFWFNPLRFMSGLLKLQRVTNDIGLFTHKLEDFHRQLSKSDIASIRNFFNSDDYRDITIALDRSNANHYMLTQVTSCLKIAEDLFKSSDNLNKSKKNEITMRSSDLNQRRSQQLSKNGEKNSQFIMRQLKKLEDAKEQRRFVSTSRI